MSVDLMLGFRYYQQKQNKKQGIFGDDGCDYYFVVIFSQACEYFQIH